MGCSPLAQYEFAMMLTVECWQPVRPLPPPPLLHRSGIAFLRLMPSEVSFRPAFHSMQLCGCSKMMHHEGVQ